MVRQTDKQLGKILRNAIDALSCEWTNQLYRVGVKGGRTLDSADLSFGR